MNVSTNASITPEMVQRLFPNFVGAGVHHVTDVSRELTPEDEATLGSNTDARRRRTFSLGRAAAEKALWSLGEPSVAIRRGTSGEPVWPLHVVGSIAHTDAVGIAVVAYKTHFRALGIDIEELPGPNEEADDLIYRPSELSWIKSDTKNEAIKRTFVFSSKEAVFKALNPLTGAWLDFQDVELLSTHSSIATKARLVRTISAELCRGYTVDVGGLIGENEVVSFAAIPRDSNGLVH